MSPNTKPYWIALVAALAGCSGSPSSTAPESRIPAEELIVTVSHGEAVDFAEHVEPGELTVFEFTARW